MSGSQQTTLGKYQIIREIARSNDIVYEAFDPVMNRRVALKELAIMGGATGAQLEERKKRFVREAKAAGSLNHPNIVTIYECGEDSGRHFIAMEYLDGHTLRNELDTHGFLPVEKGLDIAIEVLDALEYAHHNGVIHRDIKPENIQLLPDGRIKITDFGIARLTFEPNLTMDGQVFGTPSYMSPEQVVGKEIDARSDLFSLGVVMYEMLAGQKPFLGDSVVSITYGIMNLTPQQPQQANHTVWQIVNMALEKSPGLRFSTAADMKRAVEHAKQTLHSVALDPYQPAHGAAMPGAPQAPPIGNRYVFPFGGQPITYPYDPYQQAQMQQQQQQPGMSPGFVPVPIYYPPPPRPPLISVETKAFLGRLLITILILATLFGLVIVAVNALSSLVEKQQSQIHDRPIRAELKQQEKGTEAVPLPTRIKDRESSISRLQDAGARSEERRKLSQMYHELGQQHLKAGRWDEATVAFERAHNNDPTDPTALSDLGEVYYARGKAERDGDSRRSLFGRAAEYWTDAASYTKDASAKNVYAENAAKIYLSNALELLDMRNSLEAREQLYLGRKIAPPNSDTAAQIEEVIRQVTG